jgi:tetratricopeptide (TPR) repeat protein
MMIFKRRRPVAVFLCAAALLFGAPVFAEQTMIESYRMSRMTEQGNKKFHEGKYDGARAGYMRAKDMAGEKSEPGHRLHFNIGDTFYKEGDYEQSEKEFQRVLATDDLKLREKAHYNLGNVYFKQGLASQDIADLEKAVDQYQKALEIDPDDEDAKFNIEVVRRHINLKKQQQPPQQQGKSRPNPKAGEQGQQQQQEKQDQEKQQGQEQRQDQEDKDQKKEQVKPAGSEKAPEDISEEEAKRLLQALEQSEQEALKKYIESHRGRRPSKDKDW